MESKIIAVSLAMAAIASAQTPAPATEDAVARNQAAVAAQKAAQASTKADDAAKAAADLKEKLDATEGKLSGLEESYLETKSTVAGLAKLKIGGLIQAQVVNYSDSNILAGGRPLQETQFLVRRGRLKATYEAGNGSQWVMQYDIKQSGVTPQDIYVKWSEPWLNTFSIQAGLQDIPFGYEAGYSSSSMEWLERSRFERNAMFKDEKDVGVVLGISPKVPGLDAASLKIAALNGYGITDGVNDPKCFVGRLSVGKNLYDLGLGLNLGASYYMDSRINQVAAVSAKSAVKYKDSTLSKTTLDSVAAVKAVSSDYFVVNGSTTDFKRTGFRDQLDANVLGLDAQVTYDDSYIPVFAGVKLMGELYTGTAVGTAGGNARSVSIGDALYQRNVLGWYFALVQNLGSVAQLVGRYDVYDPNTDVAGNDIGLADSTGTIINGTSKADLSYKSWFFGLNVFLNGSTKLSFGYDLVSNETTSAGPLNGKVNVNSGKKNSAGKPLAASYTGLYTAASDFSKDVEDNILTARIQFTF